MIRAAAALRALLPLPRSYVSRAKAASNLPLISRNSQLLGVRRPFYQMDTRGQDEITALATRGCHSTPENQELAKKSCVPCNSKDLHPMSEDSAKKLLEQIVEGHHPDLHLVGWNNVKIDVWTHSVRGLTDNDFVLAAKINHLDLEGLLSKKARVQK
ncbi:hypothetical protein EJB05_17546 [Eragrostis curvula]|uniref:4a-hydroxytetrahydrobiopterin dehydratase n=1 Tax=Eragrostis curvula TaxID=38414 RepID=A0A5J9VJI7_9POAL|nr:hypothetical protein EJB05_17546 [Eragrostis curvula]